MLQIKKGSAQMVMGAIAVSAVSALSTPTAASAATFTLDNNNNNSGIFSTTGVIDTVNITTTGIYTIDALGAQGGRSGGLGGKI